MAISLSAIASGLILNEPSAIEAETRATLSASNSPDAPPDAPAEPYVLFVGRLVEKKGVRHLIDAMEILQQRGTPIPLVIIGDGPLAGALKHHAQKLTRVDFLGWQSNAEVRRWMRGG